MLRGSGYTDYGASAGFDDVTVFALTADADQNIWAGTRSGLLRFDGRRWQRVGPAQGVPEGPVTAVRSDRTGRVWISTAKEILHLDRHGSVFEPGPQIDSPADFLEAPDGRLWYDTATDLRPCPLQQSHPPSGRPMPGPSNETVFDDQGGLWFSASTSVVKLAASLPRSGGLLHDFRKTTTGASRMAFPGLARTLFVDREGAVWVATVGGEVHQFRRVPALPVSFPPGVLVRGALEATPDGAVWAASRSTYYGSTDGDGLWRIDGEPVHVQPSNIRSSTIALALPDGGLIVAGDGWLWRRRGGTFARDIALPVDARANPVVALANDGATNSTWISILSAGLFRRRGDTWERNGGVKSLPSMAPTALATDAAGALWIGYADGRVMTLHGTADAAVPHILEARVGAVRVISSGPRLLVAGDRGLAVLHHGALQRLTTDEPTAFDVLTGLVQTRAGDVWVNGQDGAVRLRNQELQRALAADSANVSVGVYDAADSQWGHGGSTLPYGNTMALGADGRIWFCGAAVPAWLDPDVLRPERTGWPLVLRFVTTEAGRVEALGTVHLAPGTREFQIDYTALDYTHPDRQRFRYRLGGLDDHWTPALSRRQAFFTNVKPGHYRFEVQSRAGSADWSTPPLSVDVDIAPTFVESRMFVAACCVAGALALLAALRVRDRQMRRHERAKLDERLAERDRIARELHDTLLQSTQGLALKVQAATSRIEPGDPSRAMLEQALTDADSLMIEGRDRIQGLRDDGGRPDRLSNRLGALGRALAAEHGVLFEVVVEGDIRPLQPALADEADRIGAEALFNAFRHARANRVELRLSYARREFALSVRDDGIGIDRRVLQQGHATGRWGLRGMRERAERAGALLDMKSGAGGGTEIELRARSFKAYVAPAFRLDRWRGRP